MRISIGMVTIPAFQNPDLCRGGGWEMRRIPCQHRWDGDSMYEKGERREPADCVARTFHMSFRTKGTSLQGSGEQNKTSQEEFGAESWSSIWPHLLAVKLTRNIPSCLNLARPLRSHPTCVRTELCSSFDCFPWSLFGKMREKNQWVWTCGNHRGRINTLPIHLLNTEATGYCSIAVS